MVQAPQGVDVNAAAQIAELWLINTPVNMKNRVNDAIDSHGNRK